MLAKVLQNGEFAHKDAEQKNKALKLQVIKREVLERKIVGGGKKAATGVI